MRTGLVALGLLGLIAGVAYPDDNGREHLPRTRLLGATAAPVSADALARPFPWVLIYVTPTCAPCMSLLSSGDKDERSDASRITVVIAPEAGSLPDRLASRLQLPPERLYVDDRGDFARQLQLPGAPTILGLIGDEIYWRWSGAPSDEAVRSLITSWLNSHPSSPLLKAPKR
jgi:hypothetical protein